MTGSSRPVIFDGDRRTDLWLYRETTGDWFRVSFASGGVSYQSGLWSPGWTLHRADFHPDAREDLFLYNESTGRWFGVVVDASGGTRYIGGWVLPANAQPMVLDFDADNQSDVLLYDPVDGSWRLYLYDELQSDLSAPGVARTGPFRIEFDAHSSG